MADLKKSVVKHDDLSDGRRKETNRFVDIDKSLIGNKKTPHGFIQVVNRRD
jgi:hypothetical protein